MSGSFSDTIDKLICATDLSLWQAYDLAHEGTLTPGQLVFPGTAKGTVRVSEQESKICLIRHLIDSQFSFSVETPTKMAYCFSGASKRNAMTDITLYGNGERLLNMEFKAGNVSINRRNQNHITKDIEKLVCENVDGYWFHTLRTTGNNSLKRLWDTIRRALRSVVARTDSIRCSKLFTFHCCVLQQGYSVSTTFELNDQSNQEKWLESLAAPEVLIRKGQLDELRSADGWSLLRYESVGRTKYSSPKVTGRLD